MLLTPLAMTPKAVGINEDYLAEVDDDARGSLGDAGKDCRLELTRGADVELALQPDNDNVVGGSQ